jgi:hypothetical protein
MVKIASPFQSKKGDAIGWSMLYVSIYIYIQHIEPLLGLDSFFDSPGTSFVITMKSTTNCYTKLKVTNPLMENGEAKFLTKLMPNKQKLDKSNNIQKAIAK